jgi:hypothetical protein
MTSPDTIKPFFAIVAFWSSLGMSFSCFVLFCYLALAEIALRRREASRSKHQYESIGATGELAEKFAKAGYAPSALACSVVFLLMATSIALTLDKLSILPALLTTGASVVSRQ